MDSWVAVSRSKHAKSRWLPRQGFGFAAQLKVIEVLAAEIGALLPHYVYGFIKPADNSYQFIVLVGLGGERNLYVNLEDKWLCETVPSALRGYPFALVNGEDNARVLCIDESRFSDEDEAIPLFDEQGNLAAAAADTLDFLQKCDRRRIKTRAACDALGEAGVIQEWPLKVDKGDGQEPLRIEGLYRIDEEALNALDGEALGSVRATGGLGMAYAQMFSLNQLAALKARMNYLSKEAAAAEANKEKLAGIFEDEDGGSLNFDSI
jgi:hypothetical protein